MNRRQLLKTLALLPVTPVEKLLEPVKAPVRYLMGCSEITLFETAERPTSAIDKLEALRGGPDPAMLKKYQVVAKALLDDTERWMMETFYGHDVFSPEPKDPPCTPS